MKTQTVKWEVLRCFLVGVQTDDHQRMEIESAVRDKLTSLTLPSGTSCCRPENIVWEDSHDAKVIPYLNKSLLEQEKQCIIIIGKKRDLKLLKLRGFFRKKGMRGFLPIKSEYCISFFIRAEKERRSQLFQELITSNLFAAGMTILNTISSDKMRTSREYRMAA